MTDSVTRTARLLYGMSALLIVSLIMAAWAVNTSHRSANEHRDETAAALRTLCARQHTMIDVLMAGIAIVTAERQDPGVPDATHKADDVFIALFNRDLALVRDDFNDPRSACYHVGR